MAGVRTKILLSWSSGKDSAWALHLLRAAGEYEVAGLLTTINAAASRVAMHAVREELLERQAEAAGLPLWKVPLPWPCSNEQYEAAMATAVAEARRSGITAIAFGDLFLEDIRRYREERLRGSGLSPIFPLWQLPTAQLARDMIAGGLRATLTCIDPRKVDPSFAGREFDLSLLAELPASCDPCGENGEFHTFAWNGPMFSHPLKVVKGARIDRDGFAYCDILPK